MKNYPLWKSILVLTLVSLSFIFTIPSLINKDDPDNWFLNNKINLGLDLQGGSYLLLLVESNILIKEELEKALKPTLEHIITPLLRPRPQTLYRQCPYVILEKMLRADVLFLSNHSCSISSLYPNNE